MGGADHSERPGQVHLDDVVPFGVAELPDHAITGDTCGIDEDVGPEIVIFELPHERPDRGRITNVEGTGANDGIIRRGSHVEGDDPGPSRRQQAGRRLPDAGAPAGDPRGAIREVNRDRH
jgi:hypothetical protein